MALNPTPQPTTPAERPVRRALVLCGGGATGAAYEVGVLAALETCLPGFRAQDFDIYIGTSAGALVASLTAGGVSTARFFNALVTGGDFFPLKRSDVYGFDPGETLLKVGQVTRALTRALLAARRDPGGFVNGFDAADLARTLPDGLFSLRGYERFIERFLTRHALPRYFEQIAPHLMIPANNLDTGHREVFGQGYRLDATLAQAIVASSAIPLFFNPVRIGNSDLIDGGSGKVAHVDLAVAAGATHVLVVNPIVPWNLHRRLSLQQQGRASAPTDDVVRIRERGMWGIWNQSFRISTVTRLFMGLRRFQAEHPGVALTLITPSETDETLFVTSPMNTAARSLVAQHAFDTTRTMMATAHGDAIRGVCLGAPDARSSVGSPIGEARG